METATLCTVIVSGCQWQLATQKSALHALVLELQVVHHLRAMTQVERQLWGAAGRGIHHRDVLHYCSLALQFARQGYLNILSSESVALNATTARGWKGYGRFLCAV
jgi:hypothetical protein